MGGIILSKTCSGRRDALEDVHHRREMVHRPTDILVESGESLLQDELIFRRPLEQKRLQRTIH